jgi:hypothetical protein
MLKDLLANPSHPGCDSRSTTVPLPLEPTAEPARDD